MWIRPRWGAAPGVMLLASSVVVMTACDTSRVNDFDCASTWYDRGGEVVSEETRVYLQVEDEQVAAARCKKDMLDNVPKRAKRAECQCVGRNAVAP